MNSQVVATRIPDEWFDQLQQLAQAQDSDMSKVVKEAIAQLLDINTPDSMVALRHRVSRLETQLNSLLGIASMTAASREGVALPVQEQVNHP